MKKIILIVIVFTGLFILLSAGKTETVKLQNKGVNEISAAQLHQMMEEKDFTLVNVHVPYAGEFPQTDLLIPYDKIGGRLDELPAKNQKIILYCRSDRMSTIAAKTLTNAGYLNLYNLKGGMEGWKEAGYQLIENQPIKE